MKNALQRYNDYGLSFNSLAHDMFQDMFNDPFFGYSRGWKVEDIDENDKEYIFEIELPRFQKKDIKVTTSLGQIKVEAKNDRSQYSRIFQASDADVEKADVELKLGVLSIKVPKVPEKQLNVKNIEVKEIEDKK